MNSILALQTDAIAAIELRDIERIRSMSLKQRGELLALACQGAARLEASRNEMGLPPAEPAPWPPSTWAFLAQCARSVKQR